MKFLSYFFVLIVYSSSFAAGTAILFNGNSPYSDPSKDFYDDIHKGFMSFSEFDNIQTLVPADLDFEFEMIVAKEIMYKEMEENSASIDFGIFEDVGDTDDSGFGFGSLGELDFGFEIPTETEESKKLRVKREMENKLQYIKKLKGSAPADANGLEAVVSQQILSKKNYDDPIVYYFTDHGSLREEDGKPVHSFSAAAGDLYVTDMTIMRDDVSDAHPDSKQVFIHDHCFSGGMLESLWLDKDKLITQPNTCGFAAASPLQPSYMGESFMNHLSVIANKLNKKDLKEIDTDSDGKISFGEGFEHYENTLHTEDHVGKAIPYSTHDVFLSGVYDKFFRGDGSKKTVVSLPEIEQMCLEEKGNKIIGAMGALGWQTEIYGPLLSAKIKSISKNVASYYKALDLDPNTATYNNLMSIYSERLVEQQDLLDKQAVALDKSTVVVGEMFDVIEKDLALTDEQKELIRYYAFSNYDLGADSFFKAFTQDLEGSQKIDKASLSTVFDRFSKEASVYKSLKQTTDNYSTKMTDISRLTKQIKNVNALQEISNLVSSSNTNENELGIRLAGGFFNILDCENTPYMELKK